MSTFKQIMNLERNVKKLYTIFALVMFFGFVLSGCDTLIQSSYRNLNTITTEYSAWQFYREIETAYKNMQADFSEIEEKDTEAYQTLYENFDNRENVFRLLRDSVSVLDLFYERQTEAFYAYEDLNSYIVKKDLNIAPNGYKITYGEKLDLNQSLQGDEEIDAVISQLVLPTTVEAIISTVTSSSESGIDNGYALILRQRADFPQNYDEVAALLPADRVENGNNVDFEITITQSSTDYHVVASKTIKNASNQTIYSYSRTIKIETKNNFKYLTNEITFTNGSKQTRTYRLEKETRNINLAFDKVEGKLQWYINYSEPGQIIISGEAYFQGRDKYFVKEQVRVVTATPSAYNITESFITELYIDGAIYKYKFLPGDYTYTQIAEQNVLKFGIYNNETVAITLNQVSGKAVIQAYN